MNSRAGTLASETGASPQASDLTLKHRAAMFPCYNESLHSVSPITHTVQPRRCVQITVSSPVDLWQPRAPKNPDKGPIWKRALRKAKGPVSA